MLVIARPGFIFIVVVFICVFSIVAFPPTCTATVAPRLIRLEAFIRQALSYAVDAWLLL
jgi:hypothetical protein